MSARDIAIIDTDGRIAAIKNDGSTWSVHCVALPDPCPKAITGFPRREFGINAAERHLRWHAAGKPACQRCGAPLLQKNQKRCNPRTCKPVEVTP